MMWELLQTTILRTNSKIVGTHTFRKFLLSRIHVFYSRKQNVSFIGLFFRKKKIGYNIKVVVVPTDYVSFQQLKGFENSQSIHYKTINENYLHNEDTQKHFLEK